MSDDRETVTAAIHELADRQAASRVLPLTFGGELAITEHDGDYQFRVDVDGGHFAIRMSLLDLWGIRGMTNDRLAGRIREEEAC